MFHAAPPTTAGPLLGEALLGRTAVDDHDDGLGHPHYTLRIESLAVDSRILPRRQRYSPRAPSKARWRGKWAAAAASSTSLSRMLTASLDDPRPADAFADRFEADFLDTKGRAKAGSAMPAHGAQRRAVLLNKRRPRRLFEAL